MLIRKEEPKDYEIVYSVVKDAFDSAEHSDGNEQDLVNALRKGESFIPELAYKIKEGAPDIHGIVKYAKEFGID